MCHVTRTIEACTTLGKPRRNFVVVPRDRFLGIRPGARSRTNINTIVSGGLDDRKGHNAPHCTTWHHTTPQRNTQHYTVPLQQLHHATTHYNTSDRSSILKLCDCALATKCLIPARSPKPQFRAFTHMPVAALPVAPATRKKCFYSFLDSVPGWIPKNLSWGTTMGIASCTPNAYMNI